MPFNRFRTADGVNVDTLLGPEMRSTGEVMGVRRRPSAPPSRRPRSPAWAACPTTGRVFVSVANRDKRHMIFPIKRLADLGFEILATAGTAAVLRRNGVPATVVRKHSEGPGPNGEPTIVGRIQAGDVDLVVNTPHGSTSGGSPRVDGYEIRTASVVANIACITTVQGLAATVQAIEATRAGGLGVRSLQSWAAGESRRLMVYRGLFAAVLTRIDAERAHRLGFAALRVGGAHPRARRRRRAGADEAWVRVQPVRAFGLTFRGPLGIAAGFDKNAVGIDALAAVGFSFVEVGTVTGQAQPGNPRPRLFRLVADRAVVNRMGFNNDGAAVVAARLAAWRRRPPRRRVVVGVNIGRSKDVPDAKAVADYELSARLLAPYADYLVVNVSSPNTPGLRDLQSVAPAATPAARGAGAGGRGRRAPRPAAGQDRAGPLRRGAGRRRAARRRGSGSTASSR